MYSNQTKGFTLMEILVALAILAIASTVACKLVDGYLLLRGAERRQAQAFLCATQTMEFLVHNVPMCDSTGHFSFDVFSITDDLSARLEQCNAISYSLSPVPGLAPLLIAEVSAPSARPVSFRRLIVCNADLP